MSDKTGLKFGSAEYVALLEKRGALFDELVEISKKLDLLLSQADDATTPDDSFVEKLGALVATRAEITEAIKKIESKIEAVPEPSAKRSYPDVDRLVEKQRTLLTLVVEFDRKFMPKLENIAESVRVDVRQFAAGRKAASGYGAESKQTGKSAKSLAKPKFINKKG